MGIKTKGYPLVKIPKTASYQFSRGFAFISVPTTKTSRGNRIGGTGYLSHLQPILKRNKGNCTQRTGGTTKRAGGYSGRIYYPDSGFLE